MSCHSHSRGYTLLSLLMVIALFAVIVSYTFTQFSFLDRLLVKVEAHKLLSHIYALQQKAMVCAACMHIDFNESERSYCAGAIHETLCKAVQFGFLKGMKGPPAHPIDMIKKSITFPDTKLICYPDGTISSGTIYLTDRAKTCAYALTCGVSKIPFIRIYRYEHPRWVQ